VLTDEEKIEKLREENKKLAEELVQEKEETTNIENAIEKKTFQSNNMADEKIE